MKSERAVLQPHKYAHTQKLCRAVPASAFASASCNFVLLDSTGCLGQLARASTDSLTGPFKGRSSTLGLRDSQEVTFLRPDPKNRTLINCVREQTH